MTEKPHLITSKADFGYLFNKIVADNTFPKNCYFSDRLHIRIAINFYLKGHVTVKQYSSQVPFPKDENYEQYAGLLNGKPYGNIFHCSKCPSGSCILSLKRNKKDEFTPLKCIAKVFEKSLYYTLESDSIDGINEWKVQKKHCEHLFESAGSKGSDIVHSNEMFMTPSSR